MKTFWGIVGWICLCWLLIMHTNVEHALHDFFHDTGGKIDQMLGWDKYSETKKVGTSDREKQAKRKYCKEKKWWAEHVNSDIVSTKISWNDVLECEELGLDMEYVKLRLQKEPQEKSRQEKVDCKRWVETLGEDFKRLRPHLAQKCEKLGEDTAYYR